MSVLLGQAMAGRTTDEAVEERAGWVERHGGVALGHRPLAAGLARGNRVDGAKHVATTVVLDDGCLGAGHVDGDRDHCAGEEALVELPGLAVDVEGAVLAYAAPGVSREGFGERRLVDRARDRAGPDRCRRLAEQAAVRCLVVVLVEQRE